MDKKAPLAALLLLASALPAAAEFCAFDGSRSEIVVRRLKGPACTMDNALIFNAAANENRYGADENKRTHLTDSWPGWGEATRSARRPARARRTSSTATRPISSARPC